MNSNFDTSKLLPTKFKDKTIDSFLHNTVDQFLSKKESSLIYGYIGKKVKSLTRLSVTISNIILKMFRPGYLVY